jgi:putative hemolysin
MKKRWLILIIIVIALVVGISLVGNNRTKQEKEGDTAGIANPASVNCIEKGGNLTIRTEKEGGQYGVCIFADKSECEEWTYYRGECKPGEQFNITR